MSVPRDTGKSRLCCRLASQAPPYQSRRSEGQGFNWKVRGCNHSNSRKDEDAPGSSGSGAHPARPAAPRPALAARCPPPARGPSSPRGVQRSGLGRCLRFRADNHQVPRASHPWKSRGDRAGLVVARNSCLQADVPGEPTTPPPEARRGADPEGLVPGHGACPRAAPSPPAPEHPGRAAARSGTRTRAHFRWACQAGPASRGPGRTGRGLALGTSPCPPSSPLRTAFPEGAAGGRPLRAGAPLACSPGFAAGSVCSPGRRALRPRGGVRGAPRGGAVTDAGWVRLAPGDRGPGPRFMRHGACARTPEGFPGPACGLAVRW